MLSRGVDMNINQFKYVIKIAETRNFSKASELLFISQPALSQCITRLEKELGIKLFERDKLNVEITEAGKAFVEEARKILEINDTLLLKMNNYSTKPIEQFTIGVSQFYGKYFIPKIVPIFNRISPTTIVNIKESESSILEENLLENMIDMAIFPLPVQSKQIAYETLYEEKILLAVNSTDKILKNIQDESMVDAIDLELFKDEPFVLLRKGFKLRTLVESLCLEYSFCPNVVFETENLDISNSLVHNNMGVSFVPDIISRFDDVRYFNIKSKSREIVLACKKNNSEKYHIKKLAKELSKFFAS